MKAADPGQDRRLRYSYKKLPNKRYIKEIKNEIEFKKTRTSPGLPKYARS